MVPLSSNLELGGDSTLRSDSIYSCVCITALHHVVVIKIDALYEAPISL